MTEELNCDKHRTIDQDPEDDHSSIKISNINNELDDSKASFESKGACCNPSMETSSSDPMDVAQNITPTPCLKPGIYIGSRIEPLTVHAGVL